MDDDLLRITSEDVAGRIFDSIDTASHGAILPQQLECWLKNMAALEGWGSLNADEQLGSIALVNALDEEGMKIKRGDTSFNRCPTLTLCDPNSAER